MKASTCYHAGTLRSEKARRITTPTKLTEKEETNMASLPEPRNAMEALRQATVFARAEQIISDGYSFWPDEDPTMDMVSVCKPGFLHADYWITDGGLVCDCPDFAKFKDFCKHTIAWGIVKRDRIPQLASTSLAVIRQHIEDRERMAMWEAQAAQFAELEDGRHFMEEIDLRRYLLR